MSKTPTYSYHCQACGERFDQWQSIHDNALERHDCGGDLVKVFAPPMFNQKQGRSHVLNDANGNTVTEHWDGHQDVVIRPKTQNITFIPQSSE